MRAGLQIDLAGWKVDDKVVGVGILAYESKFEVQCLFSVEERLFERVRSAPGAGRDRRYGQGDQDGERESQ